MRLTPDSTDAPQVSVIVPIYNEQRFIERCLNAILKQDYPAERMEVLVVDGQSKDNTREIVRRIQATNGRVRLLDNPERLQANGLNYGIGAATGEIIIRVDGHVLIAPDYVWQCVRLLRELASSGVVNVGGVMSPEGETRAGRAIAAATQSPFGIPTAFHHSTKAQFVDTVYLGAWPRALFDEIGLFNPAVNVNEDYELNFRIRRAGRKIFLSPDIHSTYYCRQSYHALWTQYHRYGIQKIQMLRRYPESVRTRQLVAPVFVAALVGLPVLALIMPAFGILWVLMLIAYISAAGVASQRASRNNNLIVGVMAAFAVIHIAWGSGFWRGMGQSILRRHEGREDKVIVS
jgi:succinoglycan biosynthesis protein ExoA